MVQKLCLCIFSRKEDGEFPFIYLTNVEFYNLLEQQRKWWMNQNKSPALPAGLSLDQVVTFGPIPARVTYQKQKRRRTTFHFGSLEQSINTLWNLPWQVRPEYDSHNKNGLGQVFHHFVLHFSSMNCTGVLIREFLTCWKWSSGYFCDFSQS